MKIRTVCLAFSATVCCAYADLTMIQKVEGTGPTVDMTIRIKDGKARMDSNPAFATIIDGKTGEVINLMLDQKKIVRISADKMKAVAEMVNKYNSADKKDKDAKPTLVATGKNEKINGYDAEEYVYENSTFKATYWIAPLYPNGSAILKELEALNPQLWATAGMNLPDYRAFKGVPIKTIISAGGTNMTTTLVSVKQDPIDAALFLPPKNFQEVKAPDLGKLFQQGPEAEPQGQPSP